MRGCAAGGWIASVSAVLLALGAGRLDDVAEVSDDRVAAEVGERIAAWWPTLEEKTFDRIGWAADVRTALRLGREHDRPIFLFTMDGRVNTGRC